VSLIPATTFIIISTAGRLFGTIMLSFMGSCAVNGQYTFLTVVFLVGIALFAVAYYYHDQLIELLKKKRH